MSKRTCENINCNKQLLLYDHLNRKYCSEACYYENKLRLTNEKNEQKRISLHETKMDDILKEVYTKFGAMTYISAAILESKHFDWSLCNEEMKMQTFTARVIKNYGYTLLKNETILIWKI